MATRRPAATPPVAKLSFLNNRPTCPPKPPRITPDVLFFFFIQVRQCPSGILPQELFCAIINKVCPVSKRVPYPPSVENTKKPSFTRSSDRLRQSAKHAAEAEGQRPRQHITTLRQINKHPAEAEGQRPRQAEKPQKTPAGDRGCLHPRSENHKHQTQPQPVLCVAESHKSAGSPGG